MVSPINFQATHITFICPMRFDSFPLDTQVGRDEETSTLCLCNRRPMNNYWIVLIPLSLAPTEYSLVGFTRRYKWSCERESYVDRGRDRARCSRHTHSYSGITFIRILRTDPGGRIENDMVSPSFKRGRKQEQNSLNGTQMLAPQTSISERKPVS